MHKPIHHRDNFPILVKAKKTACFKGTVSIKKDYRDSFSGGNDLRHAFMVFKNVVNAIILRFHYDNAPLARP